MTDTIIQLINKNDKVKFFAVGVGHYLGDDSVVQMLRDRGYIVTRMFATDSVLEIFWENLSFLKFCKTYKNKHRLLIFPKTIIKYFKLYQKYNVADVFIYQIDTINDKYLCKTL